MKILIPPSEGKVVGGTGKPRKVTPEELKMLNQLREKDLGVSGKLLGHAMAVNSNIIKEKTLPAIERYNGVLFKALDYASLDSKAKKYCDKHVKIFSGLFGLIDADEQIPEYKLKIQAAKHLQAVKIQGEVIDLLPKAHANYVAHNGVRVEFFKAGKQAGHFGKAIKGRFVRWLCETQPKTYEELLEFPEAERVEQQGSLIHFHNK